MAQKYIEILSDSLSSFSSYDSSETSSDDSSDSGTKKKPTKPVTPSDKSSTFLAKRKSDNEETPLKQPHQDASTPKQDILERIKRLHLPIYGHTRRVRTRTVDFGIPTLEIFLNKKWFWRRIGIIEILHNLHINIWDLAMI